MLNRRKPLKRTPFPRKSVALSRKNARLRVKRTPAAVVKLRAEWLAGFKACWMCGLREPLVVHHIRKRSLAPKKCEAIYNFAALCEWCHGELHAGPYESDYKWQLGLKAGHDPAGYDLKAWQDAYGVHGT